MTLEGVVYEVDWRRFTRGTSLFFPCLDVPKAKRTLRTQFAALGIKVFMKGVIHENVRGVRVWRT